MKNSNSVFINSLWRLAERFGAKFVTFIVEIIIARLLSPDDYGTVALITVFITILQVFVDSGLGNALIQKKDADDVDFSTVFYVNIFICIILYCLIYMFAPFISYFYNDYSLVPFIRVLGITIIISGVKNVQQAYVSRNMLFKKFFFSTLGGTIGAAFIGISMAYLGFGVWAIIAQMVFNLLVDTIILWITVEWRPKKVFSFERLRNLFSFGWKLLVSSLIDTIYTDIRQLIIGKKYSKNQLSYFNQGNKYPQFLVSNMTVSIDSVLFPSMSNVQDNISTLKSMTSRAIKTTSFVIIPIMVIFSVCADAIVSLVLTEKWMPCVPFIRIFCISYAFFPIHTANLNAIKALGRSDLILKLEVIKKIIGIISIIVAFYYGVLALAYSMLFTSFISQIINAYPNKKLLNYSYLEQLNDILPQIVLSLIMGIVVYLIKYIGLSSLMTLVLQILVGITLYVIGSKIFKIDSFEYIITTIKSILFRKRKE